jgi:serine protease inhibitor
MLGKTGLTAALAAATVLGAVPAGALSPVIRSVDNAAAANAFGIGLLKAVQKGHPHGNIVLSPVSATLNLAMVLNGASGETYAQMLKALELEGEDLDTVNSANANLMVSLRTPTPDVTLSVFNSLWTDKHRAPLQADYIAQVQRWYSAEVEDLDFGSPSAPGYINGWADKETHGKIPKVIDSIDPMAVALLLNAVYFKGQWTHKFDKAQTHDRAFTLAGGTSKTVPLMAQTTKFEYFETRDVQAIQLPYGKGDLAMDVFLPGTKSSLDALEAELTPQSWAAWQTQFVKRSGTIELPRFELRNEYVLNAPLQALGMVRAFSAQTAQFTKMSTRPVSISSVRQFTYLKVDEEGSEAAAVTSTEITMTAIRPEEPPFHMIVDRPFMCAIVDLRSHALLFLGAVYDPKP